MENNDLKEKVRKNVKEKIAVSNYRRRGWYEKQKE